MTFIHDSLFSRTGRRSSPKTILIQFRLRLAGPVFAKGNRTSCKRLIRRFSTHVCSVEENYFLS